MFFVDLVAMVTGYIHVQWKGYQTLANLIGSEVVVGVVKYTDH